MKKYRHETGFINKMIMPEEKSMWNKGTQVTLQVL